MMIKMDSSKQPADTCAKSLRSLYEEMDAHEKVPASTPKDDGAALTTTARAAPKAKDRSGGKQPHGFCWEKSGPEIAGAELVDKEEGILSIAKDGNSELAYSVKPGGHLWFEFTLKQEGGSPESSIGFSVHVS